MLCVRQHRLYAMSPVTSPRLGHLARRLSRCSRLPPKPYSLTNGVDLISGIRPNLWSLTISGCSLDKDERLPAERHQRTPVLGVLRPERTIQRSIVRHQASPTESNRHVEGSVQPRAGLSPIPAVVQQQLNDYAVSAVQHVDQLNERPVGRRNAAEL